MSKLLRLLRSFLLHIHKLIWEIKTSIIKPRCRLCLGQTKKREVYNRHFFECYSCGFIFAGDFAEFVAKMGAGMSGSWGNPETGGEREDFLVRFLAEELQKESFMLYGVGSTLAFPVLLSEGYDVYGCDVSKSVIAYRQNEYGINRFFHANDLHDLNQRFDIVVACEVIEHFNHPRAQISTLVNSMKSDGIFCGTTNFYPGGSIEDDQIVGYMSLRNHVAYWSERSLSHILNEFGMKLITFEMVCPGSVKPDRKYNDLFPNKRVFFATTDNKAIDYLQKMKHRTPILPIDLSDYPHPSYRQDG